MLRLNTNATDNAESRLLVTDYLVEATSCERFDIWCKWCKDSNECSRPEVDKWEQMNGWLVQVGELYGRTINITLTWDNLDGFLVCFWEAVSELVDYKMVDEWLDEHFKKKDATCNAMNFHNCIHALLDWKEKQCLR